MSPAYQSTPFKPQPQLLIPGQVAYLLGKYSDRSSPTFGNVISNSAVTTTGTLTFIIRAGDPPIVGALVTVRGTANSAGIFNVTNAVILTVVTNTDTGVCVITYAVSSTSQGTTTDAGEVLVPQIEVGDTLANGASVPVNAGYSSGMPDQGRVLTVVVSSPVLAGDAAGVVTLQGADFDQNGEYQDIATVATITGGSYGSTGHFNSGQGAAGTPGAANQLNYRFYRLNVTGVSGGATTIVGKIED